MGEPLAVWMWFHADVWFLRGACTTLARARTQSHRRNPSAVRAALARARAWEAKSPRSLGHLSTLTPLDGRDQSRNVRLTLSRARRLASVSGRSCTASQARRATSRSPAALCSKLSWQGGRVPAYHAARRASPGVPRTSTGPAPRPSRQEALCQAVYCSPNGRHRTPSSSLDASRRGWRAAPWLLRVSAVTIQWTVARMVSAPPARSLSSGLRLLASALSPWRRGMTPVPLVPAVLPAHPPEAIAAASRAVTESRVPRATTSMPRCPGRHERKHETFRLAARASPLAGCRTSTRCSQNLLAAPEEAQRLTFLEVPVMPT